MEAETPGHEYACWYPVGSPEYLEKLAQRAAGSDDAASVVAGGA